MSEQQGTIIYIEKDNIMEADFMSSNFIDKEVKNRAYINTLGSELLSKYLLSEGINTEDCHNIHSIKRILETVDISDILLPNIHIDVRVVFNENEIFIPKQHFALGIVPDVYAVLKLSENFDYVEFLGFFNPKNLDLDKQNDNYYFINKKELSPVESFAIFIKDYKGNTNRGLIEKEILRGRELSVSLADHDITKSEFKEFITFLAASDELRDSVLEYDNFETLSYQVAGLIKDKEVEKDINIDVVEETAPSEQIKHDVIDLTAADGFFVNIPNRIEENHEENVEKSEDLSEKQDDFEENTSQEFYKDDEQEDDNENPDEEIMQNFEDSVGDNLLDNDNDFDLTQPITKALDIAADAGKDFIEATLDSKAVELSAITGATEEAIKLAGMAGNVVSDVVENKIKEQAANLDKIDNALAGEKISEKQSDLGNAIGNEIPMVDVHENIETPDIDITSDVEDLIVDDNSIQDLGIEDDKTLVQDVDEVIDLEVSDNNSEDKDSGENLSENVEISNEQEEFIIPENIDLENNELPENIELNENIEDLNDEEEVDEIEYDYTSDENKESNYDDIDKIAEFDDSLNEEITDSQKDIFEDDIENSQNISENDEDNLQVVDFEDLGNLKETEDFSSFDLDTEIIPEGTQLPNIEQEDGIDPVSFEELAVNNDVEPQEKIEFSDDNIIQNFSSDTDENANFSDFESIENLESEEEDNSNSEEIEGDTPVYSEIAQSVNDENNLEPKDNTNIENLEKSEITTESEDSDDGTQTQANYEKRNENLLMEENFDADEDFLPETLNLDNIDTINTAGEDTSIDIDEPEEDDKVLDMVAQQNVQEVDQFSDVAIENSRIISDKYFNVGEIYIDINRKNSIDAESNLENIFNSSESLSSSSGLNNSVRFIREGLKKNSGLGLGLAGLIVVLAIVGGLIVAKMKPSETETPMPVADENIPHAPVESANENPNTLNVRPDSVVSMNEQNTAVKSPVQNIKPAGKQLSATSFIDVRKVSWEVPDYISYSPAFKQYFQSAGKSIKSSLTSDLLLATEGIYSDQIRLSIVFDKSGVFKGSKVLLSTGSAQVDKIVLQSVNQTLNVLKAPNSVGNDESTTVILKIYF
ncbi:hypothetical protein J6G99_04915 [bacterium]|nr:hypothetical protein [bacterium]